MKKLLVSGVTVTSFLIYAFYQRLVGTTTAQSPAVIPSPAPPVTTPVSSPRVSSRGKYRDGIYTGPASDAFYGNIQVQAMISGGKLSNVTFLQYPSDRGHSIEINTYAMPILKQEAISAQSANVDIVSGATASSQAFTQSLSAALSQAL